MFETQVPCTPYHPPNMTGVMMCCAPIERASQLRNVSVRLRNVSLRLRNVSLRLRNVSLRLRNVSWRLRNVSLRLRNVSLRLRNVSLRLRNVGCCCHARSLTNRLDASTEEKVLIGPSVSRPPL